VLSSFLLIGQLGFEGNSNIIIAGGFFVTNEFIIGIKLVLVLSSALVLILGLKGQVEDKMLDYEFSSLVLFSTLGMMMLVGSGDLIMLYLAIELLSLSFYVLASMKRHSQHSTEAGLKYFIFGGIMSCFLLLGMSLIYLYFGSISFELIASIASFNYDPLFFVGFLFVLIVFLFKVGAAPFHF